MSEITQCPNPKCRFRKNYSWSQRCEMCHGSLDPGDYGIDTRPFWKRLGPKSRRIILFILSTAALSAATYWTIVYSSIPHRLDREGFYLGQSLMSHPATNYFIAYESALQRWTQTDQLMDTPFPSYQASETGSLRMEISPSQKQILVHLKPLAWLTSYSVSTGSITNTLSLKDPSLQAIDVPLSKDGLVIQRIGDPQTRIGRALPFLLPKWKDRIYHRGDRWSDTVAWNESFDDWIIGWQGNIQGQLMDYASCLDESVCLHSPYTITMSPHVVRAPAWAKGFSPSLQYTGQAKGDILFDIRSHQLISNTLRYEGTLIIPNVDLAKIPPPLRLARGMSQGSGCLYMHYRNTFNLQRN